MTQVYRWGHWQIFKELKYYQVRSGLKKKHCSSRAMNYIRIKEKLTQKKKKKIQEFQWSPSTHMTSPSGSTEEFLKVSSANLWLEHNMRI